MPHDEFVEIAKLRLENAKKLLDSSQALINIGDYKSSANRSYFAVFSAMRATLALLKIDNKKHSGVISAFRQHFIKPGKLRLELSDTITELFIIRNESDYNDFYVIAKEDVSAQLKNARQFVVEVEALLIIMMSENAG
jgi:uncharacterized protein (UPF0332 family)